MLPLLVQNALGESFKDPFVIQTFIWGQSALGVPLQAATDQIHELRVGNFSQFLHDVAQSLVFLVVTDHFERGRHRIVLRAELFEEVFAGGARKHTCIGHADHVNDQLDLFSFVRAWK